MSKDWHKASEQAAQLRRDIKQYGEAQMNQDEVLFAFHRYVENPNPDDVAWWVKAFPQFADDIRAHAVEIIEMEAMARAREDKIFRLATDG